MLKKISPLRPLTPNGLGRNADVVGARRLGVFLELISGGVEGSERTCLLGRHVSRATIGVEIRVYGRGSLRGAQSTGWCAVYGLVVVRGTGGVMQPRFGHVRRPGVFVFVLGLDLLPPVMTTRSESASSVSLYMLRA